jgi:hypothetical protein
MNDKVPSSNAGAHAAQPDVSPPVGVFTLSPLSRVLLPIGLIVLGLLPTTANACSCIKVKERPEEVRAWAKRLFSSPGNIVLVRATSVVTVGDFREQANLEVVDSWKGTYPVGSVVRSDTMDVRGGMCEMSLKVGELYLAIFESEPISVAGCPVDGGVTKLQRKYLDELAGKRPNKSLGRTRGR